MTFTAADVNAYQNRHGCSLSHAYRTLAKKELHTEIIAAKTVQDLKVVLIGILNLINN